MLLKKKYNQGPPLPYLYYYAPVFIFAFLGFFDSVYLAISHYRNYVDIGYHSFCAISRSLNCDTVSQSPYSIFLGVPVPVWGVIAYGFVLFLLAFAWPKAAERKRVWTLLMVISFLFSIYSVFLAIVSSYFIHSYCIMCILSYGVNLALLFYAYIIRDRFSCEPIWHSLKLDVIYLARYPRIISSVLIVFTAVVLTMILFFPPYWQMNPPELSENIPTGITADGHPWIGAEQPELEIIEFADYRCFQCKKMHYFLRRLIEAHPKRIRLVHRHFPMDHEINPLVKEPFHTGAAKLALLAIYATEKGDFWKMNDFLFNVSRDLSIQKIAEDLDLESEDMGNAFRDQRLWNILWKDIKEGIEVYQLTGTPGFIINGKVYFAQIPPDVLKSYIE